MTPSLITPATPSDDDRQAIIALLTAHNTASAGPPNARPVAVLLADDEGKSVGGLWGRIVYDWLFVEFLALPPEFRGQGFGSGLMAQAETIAREAGCAGVWLDTFDSRPVASTRNLASRSLARSRAILSAAAATS